jgi:hypothetical protein
MADSQKSGPPADAVNDPWDPDLPSIMLSARAEHPDRVRACPAGADDYVTTPVPAPDRPTMGFMRRGSWVIRSGRLNRWRPGGRAMPPARDR